MKAIVLSLAVLLSTSAFAEGLSPSEDMALKLSGASADSASVQTVISRDQDGGGNFTQVEVQKLSEKRTLTYSIISNGFNEVTKAELVSVEQK